jgi:hypothetical protein
VVSPAVPRIAAVQVNGHHRILVISRRAAWDGATSGRDPECRQSSAV